MLLKRTKFIVTLHTKANQIHWNAKQNIIVVRATYFILDVRYSKFQNYQEYNELIFLTME